MTTSLLDTTALVRACVVALGGRLFALDVAAVREVAVFDDWTTVPLAPTHVLGVANLRGAVMPIIDAHGVLGLPPRPPERRLRTLIVAAGGLEAAIVIDGVVSLEAFPDVAPAADGHAPEPGLGLKGFVDRDSTAVPLLDAAWLLAELRPGSTS